jgi:hypothetical protein
MKVVEAVMAVVFGALGVRSLVHWLGQTFEAADLKDHLLYAVFVTGRIGLWFAVAGAFAIFATIDTRGQVFLDDVDRYRWYAVLFPLLAAFQFVAGQILGRRTPPGPSPPP